jgi:hypothetical protein
MSAIVESVIRDKIREIERLTRERDAAIRERDEVGVQLQAAQQMIAQLTKGLPLADLGVVRGKVDDDKAKG